MLIDTETNRSEIEALFTGLSNDPSFVITSPKNPNYNCIAWASDRDNEWWWPIPNAPRILDGVKYNWPIGVPTDKSLDTFKKLFGLKNYTECENSDFDPKFKKIAIYVNPSTNECTHAARQLRNGFWTSKLGRDFDIQHSSPYTIEGPIYGVVACIMQQEFL